MEYAQTSLEMLLLLFVDVRFIHNFVEAYRNYLCAVSICARLVMYMHH